MDVADVILVIGVSAIYILAGVFIVLTTYELENPIWKLPTVIFWPIALVIMGVIGLLSYISEVGVYYQDRRKEKNDKNISR